MTRSKHNRSLVQQDQDEHTRKLQLQRVRRNQSSAERAVNQILDRKARHLILGVTLNYNEDYRTEATFADLRRDRDTLFERIDDDPKLRFLNATLYRAEEGENSGGLHLHMLFFSDGRYRDGINLCRFVGEYWKNTVAPGRGDYRNSNYDAANAKPEALPYGNITGQIDRKDMAKRQGVIGYATEYLCKETQPVTARGKHERTFGVRRFHTGDSKP